MRGFAKVVSFDQVGQHLGIRLGTESMTLLRQFRAQLGVVLNDTVVDDGQHAATISMGMGVHIVGATMRGPARVSDAEGTRGRMGTIFERGHKVGDFACPAVYFEGSSGGQDGDASRVLAAIFEFAQAIKQYGSNVGALLAHVTNDT